MEIKVTLYAFITVITINLIVRTFYMALIAKVDPIQAIVPKIDLWSKIKERSESEKIESEMMDRG